MNLQVGFRVMMIEKRVQDGRTVQLEVAKLRMACVAHHSGKRAVDPSFSTFVLFCSASTQEVIHRTTC